MHAFKRHTEPAREVFVPERRVKYYTHEDLFRSEYDPSVWREHLFLPPVFLEQKEETSNLKFLRCKGINQKLRKYLPEDMQTRKYTFLCVPKEIQFLGTACFAKVSSQDGAPVLNLSKLECIFFESSSNLNRIAAKAFSGSFIRSIHLPKSVEVIGPSAFMDCRLLSHVSFEEGSLLKRLESKVFANTGICSFEIPENVEFICPSSFSGCKLEVVRAHPNNKNFVVENGWIISTADESIAMYADSLPETTVPARAKLFAPLCCKGKAVKKVLFSPQTVITQIGTLAFTASTLAEIVLPKTVITIEKEAFSKCDGLKSVSFENGSQVTTFGVSAFAKSGLVEITIPATLKTIEASCFEGCLSLKSVIINASESSLEVIGPRAFSGTGIESALIPSTVTRIGELAYYRASYLESVTFEAPVHVTEIDKFTFAWTGLTRFVFPAEIEVVRESAFGQCESLREIIWPEDSHLRVLEQSAFSMVPSDARKLPEHKKSYLDICLPASLESIGSACFHHLKPLGVVSFAPNSRISVIEEYTFQLSCVKKITIPSSVEIIKSFAFSDTSVEEVMFEYPSKVTEFGTSAFQNTSLKAIEIPASVRSIGVTCFGGCERLRSITFAENSQLANLGLLAFSIAKIPTLVIPSELEVLGKSCFYWCWELKTVEFAPNSKMRKIDDMAFAESSIQSVVFPTSVEEVSKKAFRSCRQLTSVTFEQPAIVKSFGREMFARSSIASVVIPASVTVLHNSCFRGCTRLTEVKLEEGCLLERIEAYAFRKSALKSFEIPEKVSYIEGGCFAELSPEFTVTLAPENKSLKIEGGMILSTDGQTLFSVISSSQSVSIPGGVKIIGAFAVCDPAVQDLVFEEPVVVEEFGKSAFRNSGLVSIEIPPSVKVIQKKCFAEMLSLGKVTFAPNSGIVEVGERAFQKCKIQSISLPASIQKIGAFAFELCQLAINFEEPSQLASVAENAFARCSVSNMTGDQKAQKLAQESTVCDVSDDEDPSAGLGEPVSSTLEGIGLFGVENPFKF